MQSGDVAQCPVSTGTRPGKAPVEPPASRANASCRWRERPAAKPHGEGLRGERWTRAVLYVDMSDCEVDGRFTGSGPQRTCPSAYGYSFAGGSTEDGGAHFLFHEGMLEQHLWRDWLVRLVTGAPKWTQAVKSCRAPEPHPVRATGSGDRPAVAMHS
ncbi:MAG: neutral/alkaline non-lysosomal ceramidase N-terminal domain-containing protein [Halioglobus sp.]|nr:neutral/alkaline non-lysosomal ceramidase N-terminal domain-containing protein [Halioglobus sp.]